MDYVDAIRKRPGMYIGDTNDGSGLHHMLKEVLDNAINEVLAGHADKVKVTLNADGSCTVTDNGRGIPSEIHKDEGISIAEMVMTRLSAGGMPGQDYQKGLNGLQGVGVCVVNALSERLWLTICRNGKIHKMSFTHGRRDAPLTVIGNARGSSGTEITFLPSRDVFSRSEFEFDAIEHSLRKLAPFKSSFRVVLTDERGADRKELELFYERGRSGGPPLHGRA